MTNLFTKKITWNEIKAGDDVLIVYKSSTNGERDTTGKFDGFRLDGYTTLYPTLAQAEKAVKGMGGNVGDLHASFDKGDWSAYRTGKRAFYMCSDMSTIKLFAKEG